MFDHAYAMQQLLMARLFHLGGGQCWQIYAGILLEDISWKGQDMVLYVSVEKVQIEWIRV